MSTLVWFQRDLRINNNPALNWAIKRGEPIVVTYIHDETIGEWQPGGASRWWLHHSLKNLSRSLADVGIALILKRGDAAETLKQLCTTEGCDNIVWCRRLEPHRRIIEKAVFKQMKSSGIHAHLVSDGLLPGPRQLLNKTDKPYRVFTPFYRRVVAEYGWEGANPNDFSNLDHKTLRNLAQTSAAGLDLGDLNLLDRINWHEKLRTHWQPGEKGAHRLFDDFVKQAIPDYPTDRDFPATPGTSLLSPHLHFGEISPVQIARVLVEIRDQATASSGIESWFRQLIWREFARYILFHYPDTAQGSMDPRFSDNFWSDDEDGLERWRRGQTGIPIVDAGMRQLWETGWMHNRVRMLVASLLTKNLGIHWLHGARWFWDTLVDADLANNSMGWQWVAGCGVDAAPYFRIFNPVTQATRFDPNNQYVTTWLSGRASVGPIIDLGSSRKQALDRFRQLS